jgi:hypothetical protein
MKIIKLEPYTKQLIASTTKYVTEYIAKNNNHCDSKISINIDLTKALSKVKTRPKVRLTTRAYAELRILIDNTDTEIGMHGIVTKDKNVYTIESLIVYPQKVTGATATATDDYGPWLMALPDEVFNKLRFQVHSHVNFGTFASAVDTALYEHLMTDVEDYYIFMIMNKKGEVNVMLHDIAANLIFEKEDIDLTVIDEDGRNIMAWAKDNIKKELDIPVEKKSKVIPGATYTYLNNTGGHYFND